jgi:hypothetical protein
LNLKLMSWRKFSKDPMKSNRGNNETYNKAVWIYDRLYTGTDASTYIFAFLFQFFPSAISLRHKDFFGQMIYLHLTPSMSCRFMFRLRSHISLFPILASIAIFYMWQPDQHGCSYGGCRYGKNDENNDLCFTIDDVFSLSSYGLSFIILFLLFLQ